MLTSETLKQIYFINFHFSVDVHFFINRKEVSTCYIPVSALQLFLLKY